VICGSIGTAKPQQPQPVNSGGLLVNGLQSAQAKPQQPQPVNSGGLLVNGLQSAQVNGKDTN